MARDQKAAVSKQKPDMPEKLDSPLSRGVVLVEHVLCAGCKYDLFGLPLDGVCPECGHDITASRESQRLMQAKRAAARGRRSPLRGIICVLLVMVIGGVGLWIVFRDLMLAFEGSLVVGAISLRIWLAARAVAKLAWKKEEIAADLAQLERLRIARRAELARQPLAEKAQPVAAKNPSDGGVIKPRR
jgi:hypothetical protein